MNENTVTKVFINYMTVMPGNYNCDSANVVYLIHCQKCQEAQYIGETGGNFRYRFNNHTHSITQKSFFLCHCISMQMITTLTISKFAF